MTLPIQTLNLQFVKRYITNTGEFIAENYNDCTNELSVDLATIISEWNTKLTPLLENLPNDPLEGNTAWVDGLDASTLFVDVTATANSNSFYFNNVSVRPNTILDQFGDFRTLLTEEISLLQTQIDNIPTGGSGSGSYLPLIGGTMNGLVNMNSYSITNLPSIDSASTFDLLIGGVAALSVDATRNILLSSGSITLAAGSFIGDGSQLTGISPGGILNLLEDTSPELGGDLNLNGFSLTSTSSVPFNLGSAIGNKFTVASTSFPSAFSVNGNTGLVGIGSVGDPTAKLLVNGSGATDSMVWCRTNEAGQGGRLWASSTGSGALALGGTNGTVDGLYLDGDGDSRVTGGSLVIGDDYLNGTGDLRTSRIVDGPVKIETRNGSAGTGAYAIIKVKNDTESAISLFLNSSNKSSEGGVNTGTLRNEAGDLRIQGKAGKSSLSALSDGVTGSMVSSVASANGVSTLTLDNSDAGGIGSSLTLVETNWAGGIDIRSASSLTPTAFRIKNELDVVVGLLGHATSAGEYTPLSVAGDMVLRSGGPTGGGRLLLGDNQDTLLFLDNTAGTAVMRSSNINGIASLTIDTLSSDASFLFRDPSFSGGVTVAPTAANIPGGYRIVDENLSFKGGLLRATAVNQYTPLAEADDIIISSGLSVGAGNLLLGSGSTAPLKIEISTKSILLNENSSIPGYKLVMDEGLYIHGDSIVNKSELILKPLATDSGYANLELYSSGLLSWKGIKLETNPWQGAFTIYSSGAPRVHFHGSSAITSYCKNKLHIGSSASLASHRFGVRELTNGGGITLQRSASNISVAYHLHDETELRRGFLGLAANAGSWTADAVANDLILSSTNSLFLNGGDGSSQLQLKSGGSSILYTGQLGPSALHIVDGTLFGTTIIVNLDDGESQVIDLTGVSGALTISLINPIAGNNYTFKILNNSGTDLSWFIPTLWYQGNFLSGRELAGNIGNNNNSVSMVKLFFDGTSCYGTMNNTFA